MIPTKPATNEQITKHHTLTRRVGTPASAAPTRLPPVATIRTPKRVRFSITARTIVSAITQRISDHFQTPMNWAMKLFSPLSGIGLPCRLFEATSTIP